MDLLNDLLLQLSGWIRPYLREVAIAFMATILVVYGDVINKSVKRFFKPYHFIIRTSGFVLVCAFGYGALTVAITPYLTKLLSQIPSLYLAPAIFVSFSILGLLAERKRYI